MHVKDALKFLGTADGLNISEFESNTSIYNTQKYLVDDPNFQDYQEVLLHSPPTNSFGLGKWYHGNGKLGYCGNLLAGGRSGFGIETCKNGAIYYAGGWEENLFSGQGVEFHAQKTRPHYLDNNAGGLNVIKRKGTFVGGSLSGPACYENLEGEVRVGEFNDGGLLE